MKIYEFTYTDNQNLSETELQGWASGYIFRKCQKIQQISTVEKNYDFEVIGKFLDTKSIAFDQEIQEVNSGDSTIAASAQESVL